MEGGGGERRIDGGGWRAKGGGPAAERSPTTSKLMTSLTGNDKGLSFPSRKFPFHLTWEPGRGPARSALERIGPSQTPSFGTQRQVIQFGAGFTPRRVVLL